MPHHGSSPDHTVTHIVVGSRLDPADLAERLYSAVSRQLVQQQGIHIVSEDWMVVSAKGAKLLGTMHAPSQSICQRPASHCAGQRSPLR